jgi:hypothetical protein
MWAATAADEEAEEDAAAEADDAAAEAEEASAEANSIEAARAPQDAAASRRFRKVSTLPPTVVRRPYISKGP